MGRPMLSIEERPARRKATVKKYITKNKEYLGKKAKEYRLENPFSYMLSSCKHNGAKRNLEFKITKQDLIDQFEKQKGLCFFTQIPLKKELGFRNSMSPDRYDNTKGYLKDNLVLTTVKFNEMKNDLSIRELKEFCSKTLNTLENNEVGFSDYISNLIPLNV